MRARSALLLAAAALAVAGCGDYKARTAAARAAFYDGEFSRSAELYGEGARQGGRQRLLYLLEAGIALHAAKDYERSTRYLVAADDLIEELNFVHVGEEVASVIFDDRALTYRGEEFETVLVNAFLALNFLQAGGPLAAENALVECRRFDWKLNQFNERRGREYLQNAFARYLSGIAYETDREPNEAYIDYKMVHKLRPGFKPVRRDLVRLAARLGFRDDLDEWQKKFGIKYDRAALRGTGEVVLVLECGRAPEKFPRGGDEVFDLPEYRPSEFRERGAVLVWKGRRLAATQVLEDIEKVAGRTLESRMKKIIAKRAAKAALKAAAAYGVRQAVRKATRKKQGSRGLADAAGLAVFALLSATDKADTRSWLTLPASLQVARVRLPTGRHTLEMHLVGAGGAPAGHLVKFENVEVREGRVTLLVTRTLR